ncbi:uncharacterized protein LOC132198661 [Neocloeon triangulifer]|uniref:uncharacterized protein LOC132198661 n=1 Tax=Neocloeon triangulifer TaxID=2078957 RepID=UPI00286EDBC2|nr:uncharacterized protein LOC132198661 [Neocloeon triangulifer]
MVTREEALEEYARAIEELRIKAEGKGVPQEQFDQLISESLDEIAKEMHPQLSIYKTAKKWTFRLLKLVFLTLLLYAVVSCHTPTQKSLSRHIQGFIYPFMRAFRKLTLPILHAYPELAEWHEEPCLLRNPLYGFRGPDCWPCENVRSVLTFTSSPENFADTYFHNGVPFVLKGHSVLVNKDKIKDLYLDTRKIINRSAPRIIAENTETTTYFVEDFLKIPEFNMTDVHPEAHFTWKVTRSEAARVLKKLFPLPPFVPPNTEAAIQRFIFIDGPAAPTYTIPLTDFANVWVSQAKGARLLALNSSPQCIGRCHGVSILLQEGDILFYNWQFWRSRSLPVSGASETTITFVGSFY